MTNQWRKLIIGNTASVTIQSNDIPFEQFWLFLNILSSDGVMTNDVFTGTNVPCLPDRSEQQTMNIQSDSKISITPNPAINNITLTCGKEIVKYPTKFAILNALGEIVLSGNIVQSQLEIPLKIVSGIYCFQMTSNGCVYSQKFIVLN